MDDDYVETSDQDELEESRSLFYRFGARIRESESPSKAKRRKISHVSEKADEDICQNLNTRSSKSEHHSPGLAQPRTPLDQASEVPLKSQSPETDSTAPLFMLFDVTTDSGAESPLSFPSSEDEKENEHDDAVEKDGMGRWEMSRDPLNFLDRKEEIELFPLPPSSAPRTSSSQNFAQEDAGTSPAIVALNCSMTPDAPRGCSPLPPPASPCSILLSPSPQSPPQSTDADAELARTLHEDGDMGFKRKLRRRGEHQRRPYTFDKLMYLQQMKNAPEALVTARHLERERRSDREQRRRDGYSSQDESQEQEYRPPSDLEEESHIPPRRVQQKGPTITPGAGDELLPSMSETSDEEMRDLRKEARRIEKEKRRKEKESKHAEKEREREERRVAAEQDTISKAKVFPVMEKEQGADRETTKHGKNQRNATPGPSNQRRISTSSPEHGSSSRIRQQQKEEGEGFATSLLYDCRSESPFHSGTPRADRDQSHGIQSNHDDDIGPNTGAVLPLPPSTTPPPARLSRFRSRSHFSSQESDNADDSDDHTSDPTDVKEKQQLKTLGRMYPRFMLRALGLNSGSPSSHDIEQRKRPRASHNICTDDDDDDSLRPGFARVRLRKGRLKPIKGDTESEDEGTKMVPLAPDFRRFSPRSLSLSDSVQYQRYEKTPRDQEVIEISSSSLDSSSDETDVNDEEIAEFLQPNDKSGRSAARNTLRDEQLIDYMLARNVCIGSSSSRRKGGKSKQGAKVTGSVPGLHNSKSGAGTSSSSTLKSKSSKLADSYSNHNSPGSRDYQLNVFRPGQSGKRQSLLSFENHRQVQDASRIRVVDIDPPSESGHDEEDSESQEDAEDVQMYFNETKSQKKDNKKITWRQKLKQRREAERMHGVYTHVADPGTRILANAGNRDEELGRAHSGDIRGKRKITKRMARKRKKGKKGLWRDLSLDTNEEELQRALAPPSSQHRPPHVILASTSKKLLSYPQLVKTDDDGMQERQEASNSIRADTDFALLTPGRTFGFNTYIARGLLYELLQLINLTPLLHASTPDLEQSTDNSSYKAPYLSLSISLSKPSSDFLRDLPVLCQSLGEFITGLPDADEEVTALEWRSVMRGAEEVLTGFMRSGGKELKKQLLDMVAKAIGCLISQLRTADFTKSTIDMMTLDVCWYAIEMLLRVGFTFSLTNLLSDACGLLVQYLLEIDPGIRDAMTLIRDPASRELDDVTSIVQREAELWVCLIHVLRSSVTIHEHSLWDIVGKELERRSSIATKWTLQANETIWQTIAGLCALSQFSEHGMCKDKSSLPASWKIVSFALQKVHLKTDSDTDQRLNSESLRTKDRYFALIVRRCFFLVNQWNWTIESSFPVLNVISGAFGTRKFRNLLHEKADFPEFLRTQRWDSCFEYTRRDSAFVLFLKLVVQRGIALKQSEKPYSLEKNLTLITPLSSVTAFSKANPPQGNELSMLYNRMAATAVRIHLSPSDYRSRVQQARQYFNFQISDDTSRMACIRSLMYVTQMMILENLPLEETEVKAWYVEIIEVLIQEYKELSGKEQKSINRVRFLLNAVLGSLRHILNAYNDPAIEAQYPDLSLLDVIQKIGREPSVTDNAQSARELVAVIRTFLSLRDKVVPPPERPLIGLLLDGGVESHENQESQEYGDVDIDMEDPALDALLGGVTSNFDPDIESKDRVVGKSLSPLTWLLYRCLKNMFEEYPKGRIPSPQYMRNVDDWIDTWMQCASVAIKHSQNMTWFSLCLDVRGTWRKIGNIHWRRRIEIRVAWNILKRSPMSYGDITMRDYLIETSLNALVPGKVTIEHDFLSWVFSIDRLHHPLLRNLPVTLPPHPEILALSKENFVSSRNIFLRIILDNIERSLHDEENRVGNCNENIAHERYGEFLANFFLSLKEMYLSTPEGSQERQDYKLKCKEIGAMTFEDHTRIRRWNRVVKWDAWWRGLN